MIKYYGTLTNLVGNNLAKIRELGYAKSHNQFEIVCKAKSRAEANRIMESLGFGKKVFTPDYTSETGNDEAIKFADKYGVIVSLNGSLGGNYIDAKELNK